MTGIKNQSAESQNGELVAHVLDDLITSWIDCNRLREDLDNAQRRYGDLVTRLRPLANGATCRQIYHDTYIPRMGYVGAIVAIYENGAVHLSSVEKASRVEWPKPESSEVPDLHQVANGGSIQAPLVPDPDMDLQPSAWSRVKGVTDVEWDRIWAACLHDDEDLVLTNEIVRAALAPDALLDHADMNGGVR